MKKSIDSGKKLRLLLMISLTLTYFVVEISVGYITNSTALVADSFHMFSDIVALLIAYVSIKMSPKQWSKNTFGWARAEVLGALINAVFLVSLCFSIFIQAIQRLFKYEEIKDPELILIIGGVGLFINLIGLFLFHGHGHGHGGHSHAPDLSPHANDDANTNVIISNLDGKKKVHQHNHQHHPPDRDSCQAKNPNLSQQLSDATEIPETTLSSSHHHTISIVGWENENGITVDSKNAGNQVGQLFEKSCDQETGIKTPVVKHTPKVMKNDVEESISNIKKNSISAEQMNMHGVFLHVLGDALGSVIVIFSALIVWLTDWEYKHYVDPVLSLVMVVLISCTTWPLLVQSAMVLLQTVPTHIEIQEVKKRLLAGVLGVIEIHEFHVWQLAGSRIIASAHILCDDSQVDFMEIGERIKKFFHDEGIHSTTIQLEFCNVTGQINQEQEGGFQVNSSEDCFLSCPTDKMSEDCDFKSCCGLSRRKGRGTGGDRVAFVS